MRLIVFVGYVDIISVLHSGPAREKALNKMFEGHPIPALDFGTSANCSSKKTVCDFLTFMAITVIRHHNCQPIQS